MSVAKSAAFFGWTACVALIACQGRDANDITMLPGDTAGGQSGTDSDGSEGFRCPPPVPAESQVFANGVSVGSIIDDLRGGHEYLLYDEESSFGPASLRVDITPLPGATYVPASRKLFATVPIARVTPFCEGLTLPVDIVLQVNDLAPVALSGGTLEVGPFTATLSLPNDEDLPPVVLSASDLREPRWLQLEFVLHDGHFVPTSAWYYEVRFGRRYLPHAAWSEDCARAEPITQTEFAGPDALMGLMSGTWALCDAQYEIGWNYAPDLISMQVASDGQWNAIVDDGGLRRALGFNREGRFDVRDVWLEDKPASPGPATYDVVSPSTPGGLLHPGGRVAASASGNTLLLSDGPRTVFVRTAQALGAPEPPHFAAGARAGRAGCASTETGSLLVADSAEGVQAQLEGTWALCNGPWAALRFSPGRVEALDARGDARLASDYHIVINRNGLRRVANMYLGVYEWDLAFSEQPLKLEISEHSPVADIFESGGRREAFVLSAEP